MYVAIRISNLKDIIHHKINF